jgi:hypothetical protein
VIALVVVALILAFALSHGSACDAIATDNKGHELLRKLGWVPGRGLGAREDGEVRAVAQKLEGAGALGSEARLEQAAWGDLPVTWEGSSNT